ncbi:DUF4251 domain-containing protein [Mucilaginibacter sp. dw_454]|uniref:DUF4251 domain-containing protein n=1 Tax=Mucilaginibacter sp. dw_454 TaxID=2720079 RepID=UPI001BD381E1|nr:DUF4251 domain-containing protein [Mucilaginibacter sp. dw_454]
MKHLLLLLFVIAGINVTYAQTLSAADVKKIADDKKFKFIAKEANLPPDISGTTSAVTSDKTEDLHKVLADGFTVSVKPDSVTSYLPYYDKTETVTDQATSSQVTLDAPTKSTSAGYDYSTKQKKNGDVTVKITPKTGKLTSYVFVLSTNGTAKLEGTIDNYKVIKYAGTFSAQ